MVLVTMLGGMLNALVFTVMILIFDWRIGFHCGGGHSSLFVHHLGHGAKNPPPSPRTVRSPRPSWWRRCWSMCRGMSVVEVLQPHRTG